MRQLSDREYTHERLGDKFAQAISDYDTQRRVTVLVNEFLTPETVRGKHVLDVGTGLGHFAEALQRQGAKVTAVDIGEGMLQRVRDRIGCECVCVDALGLVDHFGPGSFDIVLSSECIEHTPSPRLALQQMCRVLRPGGYLTVSTPNIVWYPIVRFATLLGLRPYDGLENFSTFHSISSVMKNEGLTVLKQKGLHLFPFQLPLNTLSKWCDDHAQALKSLMINLCVLAVKR